MKYKVEFLKDFATYKKKDLTEMRGSIASPLLKSGIIKLVKSRKK